MLLLVAILVPRRRVFLSVTETLRALLDLRLGSRLLVGDVDALALEPTFQPVHLTMRLDRSRILEVDKVVLVPVLFGERASLFR